MSLLGLGRSHLHKKNNYVLVCLLLAALMPFPKILLVDYSNDVLWATFNSWQSLVQVVLQDCLVAIIYFAYLRWAYTKKNHFPLVIAFFIGGILLCFLLFDTRVRQLWLRPIDIDLIQYALSNYKDLMSGSDAFLKGQAGLGFTFRRIFFVVGLVFVLLFIALIYIHNLASDLTGGQTIASESKQTFPKPIIVTVVTLFTLSVFGKSLMYDTEVNTILSPLIEPLKLSLNGKEKPYKTSFEQPLRAFENKLPAASLDGVKPFKNVIIVILESVRYSEFGRINESNFHMPFIKKMALEGVLQKCYVSVPHTSKSQFAILTGRNPLADIEMRESLIGKVPSIVSLLSEIKGSKSYFVTVQNLTFENTSGMLQALGFQNLVGPSELIKFGKVTESSSFGLFDDALLNFPYSTISTDKPFFLGLMTIATHYPYDYPNKLDQEDKSLAAYIKSGEAADKSLALIFDELGKNKLLDNTLVVMVGDHGQSFGEHGTFIHNSSMYEEEVTVPLIFWSSDGRLKNIQLRDQVRQIDIAPTIAELLGMSENKNYILQGTSLIKRDGVNNPPVFMSTFFSNVSQAIVHEGFKVILKNAEGKMTKYNLLHDPQERNGESVIGPEYDRYFDRFTQYTDYHNALFGVDQ